MLHSVLQSIAICACPKKGKAWERSVELEDKHHWPNICKMFQYAGVSSIKWGASFTTVEVMNSKLALIPVANINWLNSSKW